MESPSFGWDAFARGWDCGAWRTLVINVGHWVVGAWGDLFTLRLGLCRHYIIAAVPSLCFVHSIMNCARYQRRTLHAAHIRDR